MTVDHYCKSFHSWITYIPTMWIVALLIQVWRVVQYLQTVIPFPLSSSPINSCDYSIHDVMRLSQISFMQQASFHFLYLVHVSFHFYVDDNCTSLFLRPAGIRSLQIWVILFVQWRNECTSEGNGWGYDEATSPWSGYVQGGFGWTIVVAPRQWLLVSWIQNPVVVLGDI